MTWQTWWDLQIKNFTVGLIVAAVTVVLGIGWFLLSNWYDDRDDKDHFDKIDLG